MDMNEAVSAGVKLLDENVPLWWDAIDLDTLDISDEKDCILGQIFGNYFTGKDELGVPYGGYGSDYGFDTKYNLSWTEHDLNEAWAEIITQRRNSQ